MSGNNFDDVDLDLFCSETFLDDPETVATDPDEKDHQSADESLSPGNGGSDPMIALPSLSEEKFASMIESEKNHLPKYDYLERLRTGDLDMSVRRQALEWISKAHSHYKYGESALYLSMNYLDRFLSFFEMHTGGKTWAVQLLAVTCFSLGAKMAEVKIPSSIVELQVGEPKFVFEAKTIKKMELLVLSSLKWRMEPCTPLSFIDYFLGKIIGDHQQPPPPPPPSPHSEAALMGKAVKLILSTIKGIDFLEFKPSEVAAAVALLVAGEAQAIDIDKAMSCFIHVEKERVAKCYKQLQDLTLMMKNATIPLVVVPHSPNGVLEAASLSDERTVGSCPNSSNNSPDTKRKKIDHPPQKS